MSTEQEIDQIIEKAKEAITLESIQAQIAQMHKERAQFTEDMTLQVSEVANKVDRIMDWVDDAKLGARVCISFLQKFGSAISWLAKIALAAGALLGVWSSLKNGKFPDIKFFQ